MILWTSSTDSPSPAWGVVPIKHPLHPNLRRASLSALARREENLGEMGRERPEWPFWYEYARVSAGLRAEAKFVADVSPGCWGFSIKPFKDALSYFSHHNEVFVEAYTTFTAELVREGLDPSTYPVTFRGACVMSFYERQIILTERMRAREMTRHKMPTERVGGTWTGNLRRAFSSVLARRSRRVAPSAHTAASEATGACLKRESTLMGGSGAGGAAGASVATKVLNEYTCPITAEIMTDPVSTLDGFTYERTAITEWLRTNDTSPSTGAKLESKRLIPNVTVRCLLQHL